ncbi:ParB family chromosome partitioning protein [Rahnella inusitata]|nr:ParB family chromosome partitioning protein [Rahnella inusitata]
MSKQLNIPTTLRSSALGNLSKSALTRKGDIAGEVMYVDPDDCYVVVNPRKKMNHDLVEVYVAEFLDPEQGQREPCTVYPKDEKGYRIHHGATRSVAGQNAKKLKSDWKLKVIIDPKLSERSNFKNFWEQGSNNINRDNMSVFDQADWMADSMALAEAEGLKLTQTDIANQLAMSKAKVSRILSLKGAPLKIREIYESGRTTDPETLSNLVKINESNPQLFDELISETELDRATVREVMKTGKFPSNDTQVPILSIQTDESQKSVETEQSGISKSENPNELMNSIDYFVAHAQQTPLAGIELSSGECMIFMLESNNLHRAAATTNFIHDFNLTISDNQINTWGDKDSALKQAQQNLYKWTFELEKHKEDITEEQLTDALLIRDWYTLSQSDEQLVEPKTKVNSSTQKPVKAKKTVVTVGFWNEQECTLVTSLDTKTLVEKGNIIEEAEIEGLVYIQLSTNEFIKIQPEEFHLKGVKFID